MYIRQPSSAKHLDESPGEKNDLWRGSYSNTTPALLRKSSTLLLLFGYISSDGEEDRERLARLHYGCEVYAVVKEPPSPSLKELLDPVETELRSYRFIYTRSRSCLRGKVFAALKIPLSFPSDMMLTLAIHYSSRIRNSLLLSSACNDHWCSGCSCLCYNCKQLFHYHPVSIPTPSDVL